MRLISKKHQDHYHLAYCSNIHPGESWSDTFKNIQSYIPTIKQKICSDDSFGIGLRLSNQASKELDIGNNLLDFKNWLSDHNAYVFTMNGFPFGEFHHNPVKANVHMPDWLSEERLEYTTRLFKQLSYLLTENSEGGVSTSPLSYKPWYSTEKDLFLCKKAAAENLIKVVAFLHAIHADTGQYLHLDIEPEPDGVLENSQDVINFFNADLLPYGVSQLTKQFDIDEEEAREIILRHITVCYDVCHFALAYEEPILTFENFKKAGIKIGKIQISSALMANLNNLGMKTLERVKILNELKNFDEPVYLHQVTGYRGAEFVAYSDLSELPVDDGLSELRAHFHVPVFLCYYGLLQSTQTQTLAVIQLLTEQMPTRHLEIETYTWSVLPDDLKLELSDSIVRELLWVIDQFRLASSELCE